MEAIGHVRPFSSGSEGADWREANCERCQRKGEPDANGDGPCPMETAVARGFVLGTIPADLAVEYGATLGAGENAGYCDMPRQCSQFVLPATCEMHPAGKRECGAIATHEVTAYGYRRAVCAPCLAIHLKSTLSGAA